MSLLGTLESYYTTGREYVESGLNRVGNYVGGTNVTDGGDGPRTKGQDFPEQTMPVDQAAGSQESGGGGAVLAGLSSQQLLLAGGGLVAVYLIAKG